MKVWEAWLLWVAGAYGTRQHHEWQHFEERTFGTDYNSQRAVLKHSMWLTSKKARSKVLQEQDKEEV